MCANTKLLRMPATHIPTILASITEHWTPVIISELNGHHVKLAKLHGEFVWHKHDNTDELFYILYGTLLLHLRGETITLGPGDCYVVPQGVEHKPECTAEVHVLLFERAGTVNTGNVQSHLTVKHPERRC
jgi:mannose-6-phosphate isomerase-like protein (cupin superfamily)